MNTYRLKADIMLADSVGAQRIQLTWFDSEEMNVECGDEFAVPHSFIDAPEARDLIFKHFGNGCTGLKVHRKIVNPCRDSFDLICVPLYSNGGQSFDFQTTFLDLGQLQQLNNEIVEGDRMKAARLVFAELDRLRNRIQTLELGIQTAGYKLNQTTHINPAIFND